MTAEAANSSIVEAFEIYLRAKNASSDDENEMPTITEAEELATALNTEEIFVTTKFSETDIPDDSIALHMVHGPIFAEYDRWRWYFSTKQFVDDIKLADENPKIIAHFFHVDSGGGEAWYLDIAAEAVRNLKKPVVVYAESVMASAAYYLACYGTEIYAGTKFDVIGSIGTMVSFLDMIPLLEKYGAKYIKQYADQSTLKNKKYDDLREDKPEQFIKEVLNPLAAEFIVTVQKARPGITTDEKIGVFKGQTFFTLDAKTHGLIDGQLSLDDCVIRAHELGIESKEAVGPQQQVMNIINS